MNEKMKEELTAWNAKLNQLYPNLIKTRKLGGGKSHRYIPINEKQILADKIFLGLWQDVSFDYSVIANEITGTYKGKYYHPVMDEWFTIIGVAATPIQQKSGTPVAKWQEFKHTNSLEFNFPALYASAKYNACESLGRIFGRGLNRQGTKGISEFGISLTEQVRQKIQNFDFKFNKDEMNELKSNKDLLVLYKEKKKEGSEHGN